MDSHFVPKPALRNSFRRMAGKEFFILKRSISWYCAPSSYARVYKDVFFDHPVTKHESILLRPLKDVDMVLQHNKIINLRLAVSKLHGVIIKPGQTFSLWKLVGRPSRRKGYVEGMTLVNGQISKGIGGGLCQLGNLLYWMALHSPLTITERWRHGYDVFPDINRTIPFACGATLSYNYVDLQLTNTTNSAFRINLWLDEAYLQGEIVAEKEQVNTYAVSETDHQIQHQWWGGYTRHNKIWKQCFSVNGALESELLIAENHAIMMYNPFLPKAP